MCPDMRKSVTGYMAIINRVPVITKSVMQVTVKLSITEDKLESATTCIQDMLFIKNSGKYGIRSGITNDILDRQQGSLQHQQLDNRQKDKTHSYKVHISKRVKRNKGD